MIKNALISDVDNTLFDWVDIWYKSFSAMLEKVCEISGLEPEDLYPSISKIHQKYHTSEYSFLLEEIPELREVFGDKIKTSIAPAIAAYREARQNSLVLYPDVMDTLIQLKNNGVILVAYTESMSFYSNYRFRKLGLDNVFDYLYSPPDHELPSIDIEQTRRYPQDHYSFKRTVHRLIPRGEMKPNPHILKTILNEISVLPSEAVYVGDSLMKDIAMAQQAGVLDVHAAYGTAQHREQYELLKKVTHWSPTDVAREKAILGGGHYNPTITLETGFSPIIRQFTSEEFHA